MLFYAGFDQTYFVPLKANLTKTFSSAILRRKNVTRLTFIMDVLIV